MIYRVTASDPPVTADDADIVKRVAVFMKNQGITTQTQWENTIATAFNATNASGLSANTRTLMIEYFTKRFRVG